MSNEEVAKLIKENEWEIEVVAQINFTLDDYNNEFSESDKKEFDGELSDISKTLGFSVTKENFTSQNILDYEKVYYKNLRDDNKSFFENLGIRYDSDAGKNGYLREVDILNNFIRNSIVISYDNIPDNDYNDKVSVNFQKRNFKLIIEDKKYKLLSNNPIEKYGFYVLYSKK